MQCDSARGDQSVFIPLVPRGIPEHLILRFTFG
jgi:hypothetical protein